MIKFKNILKSFNKYFLKSSPFLCMASPLIVMDIITRLFGYKIHICGFWSFGPFVFDICWIVLLLNFTINLNNKIGKKLYLVINLFFLIVFCIQNIYYSTTHTFFNFNLLKSFNEGVPYIFEILKNCSILVYLSILFIIILIVLGYKNIPVIKKNNYSLLFFTIIWCVIIHSIAPIALGEEHKELSHISWVNQRNNYISFSDSNKSMKISGLFEFTFRDFYLTYLKSKEKETPEDTVFLNNAFAEINNYKNEFSGIFKNKNLIFIQLEGIDDWLVTEDTMPTLYNMMKNSYNFSNHYSYYTGGGSTFNSELAVNTGFITPLSYTQNPYTFNKNNFPYSMANIFKNEGYTVNAFHMNTGEYYSRTSNYINWGYDNYYGLIEIQDYDDESYNLDRELILNKKFNELLFQKDKKFVDYIITYSTHMPFSTTDGVCKLLYKLDGKNTNKNISETECVKRQAKETDYMIELLVKNLEEKNLLEDTVIVAFTDHFLYTLDDRSILNQYKDTSSNLINHTPFLIWSKDIESKTINEVTSQIDILPTVLNLFGLYSNPNNYIGKDALDQSYEGIAFFNDYSWYDGNVYVVNGSIVSNNYISNDLLNKKNEYVSYITKKNDLALKFDYFK